MSVRGKLVIGPTVNAPAFVDQAILPFQIIPILLGAYPRRTGVMEHLAVDFECIAAIGRDQGVIYRAGTSVDVRAGERNRECLCTVETHGCLEYLDKYGLGGGRSVYLTHAIATLQRLSLAGHPVEDEA